MDAKNSFLPEAFQRTSFKGQKTDSWRNVVTLMQPKTPDEIFIIFFKQEKKFFFFLFFRAFESFLSGLFRRLTNREQLEQPLQEKWKKYEKKNPPFFSLFDVQKNYFSFIRRWKDRRNADVGNAFAVRIDRDFQLDIRRFGFSFPIRSFASLESPGELKTFPFCQVFNFSFFTCFRAPFFLFFI